MVSRFTELIVDCADPQRLAQFWCGVLGYRVTESEEDLVEIVGWEPSADAIRERPVAPTLVFIRVPEAKTVKDRIHIDVSPIDGSQEEEVERILGLGARKMDIGQGERSWVVLSDPEGNEFCVLRSLQPA